MRTTKAANRRMTQLLQQLDQPKPEEKPTHRPSETEPATVVAMRLPVDLLREIDQLIPALHTGQFADHVTVRRSDVLRLLINEGLRAVRKRL